MDVWPRDGTAVLFFVPFPPFGLPVLWVVPAWLLDGWGRTEDVLRRVGVPTSTSPLVTHESGSELEHNWIVGTMLLLEMVRQQFRFPA